MKIAEITTFEKEGFDVLCDACGSGIITSFRDLKKCVNVKIISIDVAKNQCELMLDGIQYFVESVKIQSVVNVLSVIK